ncbi:MAG: Na+-transporting NADH:ubiquinone oxidoreductase subunit C, partial [Bermanella sp.]
MASNDSIKKTLLVAVALCIVCSLVVSGAAVLLKPAQIKNKALDRKSNILAAAGMLEPGQTSAKIEEEFLSKITP